jgi:hypothetical protein
MNSNKIYSKLTQHKHNGHIYINNSIKQNNYCLPNWINNMIINKCNYQKNIHL